MAVSELEAPQTYSPALGRRLRPLGKDVELAFIGEQPVAPLAGDLAHDPELDEPAERTVDSVLDLGVALLQKPITPEMLLRRVREVLDSPRATS